MSTKHDLQDWIRDGLKEMGTSIHLVPFIR
jgi:hypothetical protein